MGWLRRFQRWRSFLDVGDIDGYGPEYITLENPPYNGIYEYNVHYYSDYGHGPSNATVKIWINDVLVFTETKLLYNHDVWDCAYI